MRSQGHKSLRYRSGIRVHLPSCASVELDLSMHTLKMHHIYQSSVDCSRGLKQISVIVSLSEKEKAAHYLFFFSLQNSVISRLLIKSELDAARSSYHITKDLDPYS